MARKVYKYTLRNDGRPHEITLRGNVVHLGHQPDQYDDNVVIWAEHKSDGPTTKHVLQVFSTGEDIPAGAIHIGTTFQDDFVWHTYEVG